MTSRTSTLVFATILLFPVVALVPGSNISSFGGAGGQVQPMQPVPTGCISYCSSTAIVTSQCDPTRFYLISTSPQVQIITFSLDKQTFHPGDTVSYSGMVQVSEVNIYANCIGQAYNNTNAVSPSQASVQVTILGNALQSAPSSSGEFSGTFTLPLTTIGGNYAAVATANFQGSTDTRTAPFTVVRYNPTLSITYPTLQNQAYPGDYFLVEGDGWIPNTQMLVIIDDNFNVTTDSAGHFVLQVPVSLNNPPSEGNHTITVEQGNLMQTTTLSVKYRTLLLSVNAISPVVQGQNVSISGNVTTLETDQLVPNATLTVVFMGHPLSLQTNQNGTFRTRVWVDPSEKPGGYMLYVNATRRGFHPSAMLSITAQILPATNVPLVAMVAATGAAAGVATSAMMKKVSKPMKTSSIGPGGSTGQTSIGPGTQGSQSSIGPGAEQLQPKFGTGQGPSITPGHAVKSQTDLGEIRAAPVPTLRGTEFCIHCGLEIKRDSPFCPECGLRLR